MTGSEWNMKEAIERATAEQDADHSASCTGRDCNYCQNRALRMSATSLRELLADARLVNSEVLGMYSISSLAVLALTCDEIARECRHIATERRALIRERGRASDGR